MTKKVLITSRSFGKINDDPFNILHDAGFETLKLEGQFSPEEFEDQVVQSDALIIGAHDFPKEVLRKASKLKIICKHGAGLDNIPLETAKELGIIVCNAPDTNSNSVADLVFGLMLNVARGITLTNKLVDLGKWQTNIGVDVNNKNLGIFGFGAIGKCVAKRANGFNMKVWVYDPFVKQLPEEFKDYVCLTDKETVLKKSDFLTVHLPLNEETRNIISDVEMKIMKKGSYIVNTARGGIVNELSLYNNLKSGHLAGAALDVTEQEPINRDNPLLGCDNVIITPHIGMYSKEAISAVGLICANNIANFERGDQLKHQVC